MPSPLAADVAVCRQNFVVFWQVVLSEEQSNRPVVLAPHHRSLVDVLDLAWEEGKHCFLLAPVRHGKTTLLEGLVLYMLGNYRWTRTKIASANQDIAQDRTAKIRRLLKESGRVQALWPDLRIVNPDRPEKIFIDRAGELARDAALHAVGVATGVTGSS